MKKTATVLAAAALTMTSTQTVMAGSEGAGNDTPVVVGTSSGGFLESINSKGYGTFSGRFQLLGMYRDYDNGNNGHATTLGAMLGYVSPNFGGFELGATYNYAGTLFDGGNTGILLNDDINVLNEAWLRYNFGAFDLEKTSITVGRQVINGEVFRKDDFRQKACAVEAIQFTTKDISNLSLTVGHAIRMSNWIGADHAWGNRWDFNDFGQVPGLGYGRDTDGVTWAEAVYTGIEGLEISVFDAYAWDISNLIGTRIQYNICDEAALIGYYRHEGDVGNAPAQNSDAWGISYRQKIGGVTLEPGYFAVHGDNLRFQETTTGINHPLGSTMIICNSQFNGGAKTAFLKATTKINKTALYALYSYTWHDHGNTPFDAQELNVVVKQIISDNFAVGIKAGVGLRDQKKGVDDTTLTDARVFMTYTF